MPHRRAPFLALVLSLALVAYPVTMPLAMAVELPPPMPMSMHGGQHASHHQSGHQHHAANVCCAGVCGSCPVVAVSGTVAPPVRASATVVVFQDDASIPAAQSALRRLPYSIGPPPAFSLA